MSRFKDFGSPASAETAEPLKFKIYEEEFVCHPEIPGKILLEFIKNSDSDRVAVSASALTDFFEKVLVDESWERFDALTSDPKRVVSMTMLAEIVSWLLEEYSDRPTQGSEHSPTGA